MRSVTKPDSFPVPKEDDCNDNIGYLIRFWQIPLTERAKVNSASVTPHRLY